MPSMLVRPAGRASPPPLPMLLDSVPSVQVQLAGRPAYVRHRPGRVPGCQVPSGRLAFPLGHHHCPCRRCQSAEHASPVSWTTRLCLPPTRPGTECRGWSTSRSPSPPRPGGKVPRCISGQLDDPTGTITPRPGGKCVGKLAGRPAGPCQRPGGLDRVPSVQVRPGRTNCLCPPQARPSAAAERPAGSTRCFTSPLQLGGGGRGERPASWKPAGHHHHAGRAVKGQGVCPRQTDDAAARATAQAGR